MGTAIFSGLEAALIPSFAEANGALYFTNGWDPVKVWDGITAAVKDAGMAAPPTFTPSVSEAAGNVDIGVHTIRYRYKNSLTGYVSEPSDEHEHTVATSAKALTIAAAASGTNIRTSTDAKVDKIVVEMTLVSGNVFFRAVEIDNAVGNAVINYADSDLEMLDLGYEDYGHEQPPKCAMLLHHKGVLWCIGQITRSAGLVTLAIGATRTVLFNTAADLKVAGLHALIHVVSANASATYRIASVYEATRQAVLDRTIGSSMVDLGYDMFPTSAMIAWPSMIDRPESFNDSDDRFIRPLNGMQEYRIQAAVGCKDDVMFFGDHSAEKYSYVGDPMEGALELISDSRGSLSLNCVKVAEDKEVYSMDRLGPWRISRGNVDDMVLHVLEYWDLVDPSTSNFENYSFVLHDPVTRKVWFFVYGGATQQASWKALVFDRANGFWYTFWAEQTFTCGALVLDDNGRQRLLVWDSSGHSWFLGVGTTDGANTGEVLEATTAAGSSQTSIICVAPGWSSSVFKGAYAYNVTANEARLITDNSATTLTTEAFTAAPAAGEVIHIGRSLAVLKTPVFRPPKKAEYAEVTTMNVILEPAASAHQAELRVYENSSAAAKADYAADAGIDYETVANDDDIKLKLQCSNVKGGVIQVPISSSRVREFEFEFRVTKPRQTFKLLEFYPEEAVDPFLKRS